MKRRFTFLLLLAMMFAASNVYSQLSITYYVSAANGNDANAGNSPGKAFKTLRHAVDLMRQDGIDESVTILVEKGTYYPYDENGDLSNIGTATFQMFRHPDFQAGKSLRVLGGYDFSTGSRDVVNNPTILDGGRTSGGGVDHVIVLGLVNETADSLVIDGFTVTGAGQTGAYNYEIVPGKLFIISTGGGGIEAAYCTNNKIAIRNCIFTDNEKWVGAAAGLQGSSGITFQNCVFSKNTAGYDGPNTGIGGAVYFAYSSSTFLNCIFYSNIATEGAAMYIANDESPQTVSMGNCTFAGNTSPDHTLIKSVISGKVQLTNSIIRGNSAFRLSLPGTIAPANNPSGGDIFVSNNIRQSSDYDSGPVYTVAPAFKDLSNPTGADGKWFTADDGLQINACDTTPALDGGNNAYAAGALAVDILGRPRIYNDTIDLGAYEDHSPLHSYYRDADGDGFGSGAASFKFRCVRPGYSDKPGDCDDNDNTIYPGAREICGDGKDNNCNGIIDGDAVLVLNLEDKDGDGFGDPNSPPLLYCELLPGHSSNSLDCDDNDATIYPGAPEICGDGKDNNCDGRIDENAVNYYLDADGDGYGKTSDVIASCTPVAGRVTKDGDCDDNDNTVYPGAPEICDGKDNDCNGQVDDGLQSNYYLDADGDGYGKTSDVIASCTPITGRVTQSGDCDDNDNTVYPGAPEICDGKDNNCNGQVDEDFSHQIPYYRDTDGDGYGDSQDFVLNCTPVLGRVTTPGDCNDNDPTVYPGAPEICDGKDNNCDGQVDENITQTSYYLDIDGDGYGNSNDVVQSCSPIAGRVTKSGDCNDNDPTVYPGAPEVCDGKDNDCNGTIDDNKANYYLDADEDGYGKTSDVIASCTPIAGRVTRSGDCDDNDKTIYPGAPEICDGKDNNCNGQIDENITKVNYYLDADGDGYGKTSDVIASCTPLAGRVTKAGDCNDNDKTIYPGAPELCDGKDNDCNGKVDDKVTLLKYYVDADGDGYGKSGDYISSCTPVAGRVTRGGDCNDNDNTIYPGAPEICDGKDNNCDGRIDETKANYYLDADGDGYGKTSDVVVSCTPIAGRVTIGGDCNDNDKTINPGAAEIPGNGKDDNCNGVIDESVCANPATLSTTNITKNSALLKWTAATNPVLWEIQFKKGSSNTWITVNVVLSGYLRSFQLYGLSCGTQYHWRIRALCGKQWNEYSTKVLFTTNSCSGSNSRMMTESDSNTVVSPALTVWPNPTNGSFTLSVNTNTNENQTAAVKVVSLSGEIVYQENVAIVKGILQKQVNLPARFSAGVYIVSVTTNNSTQHVKIEYLK